MKYLHAHTVIYVLSVLPLIVLALLHAVELKELRKHPTYHCDASDKLGYPAPGTPEARACWIKEK